MVMGGVLLTNINIERRIFIKMHTITLYTDENSLANESRKVSVKVQYKIELNPDLKDLDPSLVYMDVGEIKVFVNNESYLTNAHYLALAELTAVSAIIMKSARNSFGAKKSPQYTAVQVNLSQPLSQSAMVTPSTIGKDGFSNWSYNYLHLLTAYMLGVTFKASEDVPYWLGESPQSFYITSPQEIRERAQVHLKNGRVFEVTRKALIDYIALPHIQKNNITRPYIALQNKMLKTEVDGRLMSRKLTDQPQANHTRYSHLIDDGVMITTKPDSGDVELVIKFISHYTEETLKKYEGQHETNITKITKKYTAADQQVLMSKDGANDF